jgi:hypothetical protein
MQDPLLTAFARAALGSAEAKCGAAHAYKTRQTKARIFPVRNKHNSACFAPLTLTPQISGFHVLVHAYARLHTPRISLLSDVLFSKRLARQGPSLHCSSPAAPCQSTAEPFPVSRSSAPLNGPSSPLSYFNHYSETSAPSRHWLAVVRKHSLLVDDRGCVSWAPMGGSTVP